MQIENATAKSSGAKDARRRVGWPVARASTAASRRTAGTSEPEHN
jgi:hypothetical protein